MLSMRTVIMDDDELGLFTLLNTRWSNAVDPFLPARRYLARVLAVIVCFSVCPSVCHKPVFH